MRSERFYYDGIRRIQEVVIDPVASGDTADESGDPGLQAMAAATTPEPDPDTSTSTLAFESEQIDGRMPIPLQPQPRLSREYVWGPGDGPGGIDELLVQFAPGSQSSRDPWWVLQDSGGDVAALCDLGGPSGDARVVAQWTWDAYGQPFSFHSLHSLDARESLVNVLQGCRGFPIHVPAPGTFFFTGWSQR